MTSPPVRVWRERDSGPAGLFVTIRGLVGSAGMVRELIRRDIHGRFRDSLLGGVWSVLSPLLLLAVYMLVFTVIFKTADPQTRNGTINFPVFLWSGLLLYSFFSETVVRGSGLLVEHAHLIKKVVFPVEVLPVVAVGHMLFNALIGLVLLIVLYVPFHGAPPWTVVLVPLIFLPFCLLMLGFAWIASAIGLLIRDTRLAVSQVMPVFIFITPIFYSYETLPAAVKPFALLCPITPYVVMLRQVVFWGEVPGLLFFGATFAVAALVAVFGLWVFLHLRDAFADVV